MGDLPHEKKACTDNAREMPDVGFFNDSYRDIIKGATFDKTQKGYVGGDINYAYGMKYALTGSTIDFNYNARFIDANQSINYAECHDNNTLYDKLTFSNGREDKNTLLPPKRILGRGSLSGGGWREDWYSLPSTPSPLSSGLREDQNHRRRKVPTLVEFRKG